MNKLLNNKKSAVVFLFVVLLIGIFFVGRFFFENFFSNKQEIKEDTTQTVSVSENANLEGFSTADELDKFLDYTSWEGTDENGNKSALMFLGDTGAEYKMVQVCKMQDDVPTAFRVSYSVIDGKTILYDAKNSSAMVELECLVSEDRKSVIFDNNTYYKADVIDWID